MRYIKCIRSMLISSKINCSRFLMYYCFVYFWDSVLFVLLCAVHGGESVRDFCYPGRECPRHRDCREDQVFRSGRGRVIRSCTTGQPITFCKLASGNDPLKLGLTEQPRDKIKKP